MKKIEIPLEFVQKDSAYTIQRVKEVIKCPICEGEKRIEYKNKTMRCPECMGKGELETGKTINVVCDELFIVSTIKVSISSTNSISVKYKGHCGLSLMNRAAENLFRTKEKAQEKCDELNKKKIYIDIDDIIINDSFKNNPPSIDKIQTEINYYKVHEKFNKDIIIDEEKAMQDGYITFLACKHLKIKNIKAVLA